MPQCIAGTDSTTLERTDGRAPGQKDNNCFRLSELSADGTTIVTYNDDEKLRTFVLPVDLLEPETGHAHQLKSYATSSSFKSYCFALYPGFDLQDLSTTLVLQSRIDGPVRLTNVLNLDYIHASYPLVNPTTESFVCPQALAFTPDGTRFVAGSKESIAVFDIHGNGEGPISSFPTRPGRKARQLYGVSDVGLAGIINSLTISTSTSVLAAGSTGGQVALYDQAGLGEQITSFKLDDDAGNGISQMRWDSSGNWLFIAGRQSDSISIYDMRSGRRQCLLVGRRARTTLRLGFDLVQTENGCDVWAGGTDGRLRIWKDVISREGILQVDETMLLHSGAVSNVMIHRSQSVAFTTCGQRNSSPPLADDCVCNDDLDRGNSEVSLKAWIV